MKATIAVVTTTFVMTCISSAQVKIDLKTSFAEKQELTYIKAAAKSALNGCNMFVIREIGEDYSLWIKEPRERLTEKGLVVELRLELRTAAAFTNGRLLNERLIAFVLERDRDYSCMDTLGITAEHELLRSVTSIATNAAGAAAIALVPQAGLLGLLTKEIGFSPAALLSSITANLGTPTAPQRWKAIMAAVLIEDATRQMILEVQSR